MKLETTAEQRDGAIRRTREFGESCLAGGRFAASLANDVNMLLVELQQMTEARDALRARLTACEDALKGDRRETAWTSIQKPRPAAHK